MTSHTIVDQELPSWLWWGTWIALSGVVGLGLLAVILLANGAADPPRAGPLIWTGSSLPEINIPAHYTTVISDSIRLPTASYTLEAEAGFSADSDPAAWWEIVFETPGDPSVQFAIVLRNHRFFSVPPMQPDSVPFIHIRRAGESNKVTLHVEADRQAILRINDEIAWRGVIPAVSTAIVRVAGGESRASRFTMWQIALYAAA